MQLFALVRHSHFFLSRKKATIFRFLILWAAPIASFSAPKIKPAIILASIEGEAHSLSLNEEFKVTLDQSSVGKKIKEKTIVVTGKDGKAQLLFSNGALITIKPGSRFYLRKYDQKIVSSENVPEPSKIEEEPSNSTLLAHLDFGELIVKAPKLKKGSTMTLSSPLGVAGVRGTMFQMMAVRNPVTGDISGGINLISGDIDFSGVDGNQVSLVSGQSIQAASSKLGEAMATQTGGLIDLTSTYGPALTGNSLPPTVEQIFPGYEEGGDSGSSSDSSFSSASPFGSGNSWEMVHELATDIFFSIEEAETASSNFSFENISNAVTVNVPEPALTPPVVPAILAGGPDSPMPPEPFLGAHPTIPNTGNELLYVELFNMQWTEKNDPWLFKNDISTEGWYLPFSPRNSFYSKDATSSTYDFLKIQAVDFLDNNLAGQVKLVSEPPDLTKTGSYDLIYEVSDLRGLSTSVAREVQVVATPPQIDLFPENGNYEHRVRIKPELEGDYKIFARRLDSPHKELLNYDFGVHRDFNFNEEEYDAPGYNAYLNFDPPDGKIDLTANVNQNPDSVDDTKLGTTLITLSLDDSFFRGLQVGNGGVATKEIVIEVVDDLPPIVELASGAIAGGSDFASAMQIKGIGYELSGGTATFIPADFARDYDPGIVIKDNFYSQSEIDSHRTVYSVEVDENGQRITGSEQVVDFVDMKKAGYYKIIHDGIIDPSDNFSLPPSIERWVKIIDDEQPILTLYGANPLYVDLNSSNKFKDPGVFAIDNLDGQIEWDPNSFVVTVEKLVDDDGTYELTASDMEAIIEEAKKEESLDVTFRLTYKFTDRAGNQGEKKRQIVLLNSPIKTPKLVLHGEDPLWHEVNTEFADPGVTAYKELGAGLEPINLNEYVTINAYLLDASEVKNPDYPSPLDPTKVNFYGPPYQGESEYYVNKQGARFSKSDDLWRKHVIRYTVTDPLGNFGQVDREVRIIDSTPPEIVMNAGSQGLNFPSLQGGFDFEDPGAVVTDNYDKEVELQSTLLSLSDDPTVAPDEIDFAFVEQFGFTQIGSYRIKYESTDSNDNAAQIDREIEVIDTIAPQVAIISHGVLLEGNALQAVNPVELENVPIVDSDYPIPSLSYRNGVQPAGVTGGAYDTNVTRVLSSQNDFYLFAKPEEILFEGFESIVTDEKGSRGHYSGFRVVDASGQTILEDPGIYFRNDTDVEMIPASSYSTIKSSVLPNEIIQYRISYSVSQSTGEVSNLSNTRDLYIIDTEKPTVYATPDTSFKQVVIEASRDPLSSDRYTDVAGSIVKLYDPSGLDINSSFESGETLILRAVDKVDGIVTNSIQRVIKDSTGTELGRINDNSDTSAVAEAVASTIDATVLDSEYVIEYTATDTPIAPDIPYNTSDVVTRRLIVKDTLSPTILISELNSTLTVDYKSTTNPNVMDEASVVQYMLTGLSGSDANNFDQNLQYEATRPNGDPKWTVTFDPPFVPGAIYPEERDVGLGYKVTIYLSDDSGNKSGGIIRYLKVGDYQPPVLTLIGNSEIHDFLRFASSTSANTNQSTYLSGQGNLAGSANSPFTDRPEDSSLNPDINATGFAGGEHRLLRADYDFVDPGVYAEDDNAYFDIKDGYPDLDGDGIGEGHLIVRVSDRTSMEDCSEGAGKIHLYSWFEKNSYTMKDWQERMGEGNYGYNTQLLPTDASATGSPAKVPDVDGEHSGGGHAFTDLNKTDLTNFDMTTMTIEYRAKDGWDNKSEIATRRIYIYESRQFDGYAFYATPLTDASGADFEQFYDNGSGDPFLTSARKDLDGDGVSDFWEFALGTDYQKAGVPGAADNYTPDIANHETFKNLHFEKLSTSDLNARLQGLHDAAALNNVTGLRDFNATSGL